MFEIWPSNITVYPSDRITFTARAIPPPVIWNAITNGTVQSDRSVKAVNNGLTVAANIAHKVTSGISAVEMTLTNACIPSGVGINKFVGITGSTTVDNVYRVWIKPTVVEVRDSITTLLASFSHTPVAGQVFKIEIANTSMALYIDGVFKNRQSNFFPTNSALPAYCAVDLEPPMSAPDMIIPSLVLRGNWVTRAGNIVWTTPAHGSLSSTSGSETTDYFNATIPGVYILKAEYAPASDNDLQIATAQINIPPLSIISESVVTLQPSQKVRFPTTYDGAQTSLVTWSVVSGAGSFSLGEFTAGTAPGTSVIRATSGSQFQDLTIVVPPVITSNFAAAQPGEVITFSTNIPTATWSASCGTASGSGATFLWTAPSQAGVTCKVTATGSGFTKIVDMPVLKLFPYDPNAIIPWDRRKTVLVSRAEDRTRLTRVKDKLGLGYESYELTFNNRDLTELQAAHAFWEEHYPGLRFIFANKVYSPVKRLVGYFDSDFRTEAGGTFCPIDYSFRFIEG